MVRELQKIRKNRNFATFGIILITFLFSHIAYGTEASIILPIDTQTRMFDLTANNNDLELLPAKERTLLSIWMSIDTTQKQSLYCGSALSGWLIISDNMGVQWLQKRDGIFYCTGSINAKITNNGGAGGDFLISWIERDYRIPVDLWDSGLSQLQRWIKSGEFIGLIQLLEIQIFSIAIHILTIWFAVISGLYITKPKETIWLK